MNLSGVGVWSGQLRYADEELIVNAAGELERLGYTSLWIPDTGGDVFGAVRRLLAATESVIVGTGIMNLWMHDIPDVARAWAAIETEHPGRFLLGIGVSHGPLMERLSPGRYNQPLAAMQTYLTDLDNATPPVPADRRVLAALGPRMLELARDRAAGAHPYFVTPDHTAFARGVLGTGPLLAPEQTVLLETDPATARAIGREFVTGYLTLPNYVNNLRRFGFDDDDFTAGGSDRLVDAIVAWGDEDAIAARVREHHDAGADHVCIQVLGADRGAMPWEGWRRLAPALT